MKKILISIIAALSFNFTYAQDCPIPSEYLLLQDGTGNTGANMTIMLTGPAIESMQLSGDSPYIVAFASSGLLVGSQRLYGQYIQNGGTSLSIWGDDSSTEGVTDGAVFNEVISFQIVDGSTVYDYSPITPISFSVNGLAIVVSGSISVHCGDVDVPQIEFPLEKGKWNMVAFTSGVAENIVSSMNEALSSGTIETTFDIIKNSKGQFWNENFSNFSSFTPGEGYMMYVKNTVDGVLVNFQKGGVPDPIEFQLEKGKWNMVGFTSSESGNIVTSMNAALSSGTIETTFDIIKNSKGQFWNENFSNFSSFTPGEGYMMYVKNTVDGVSVTF